MTRRGFAARSVAIRAEEGCCYCGRRIWRLARIGLAYDNHGAAHLRCCSAGRRPLRIAR